MSGLWRKMTLIVGLVAFALSLGVAMGPANAADELVVSTLPFDRPAEQQAVFSALSKSLSTALGRPVRFQASKTYQEVIDGLQEGTVDVALVGAPAYIRARSGGEVRAILRAVRKGKGHYKGVIIAPKDSPVSKVGQLGGKSVAFVDRNSAAGYLFPKILFQKAGLVPVKDFEAVMAGSHRKVVELVADGKVAAGACFDGAQAVLTDPGSVRVVATTQNIPGDPVVVRTGLGRKTVSAIRRAMIEMSSLPEAEMFFVFAEIDGFVPAFDKEYDGVAKLLRQYGG